MTIKHSDPLTRILARVGVVLVWFPLLAPVALGIISLAERGRFLLDYLMPAELFPSVLVGGGLLLWAALRRRAHGGLIGGGLAAAVVFLVGAQGLAVVTGLASGAREAAGWPLFLVNAGIALYAASVVAVGAGGLLLIRDERRTPTLRAG